MKIVEPSYEILTPISNCGVEELKLIERAARTCYKSEDKILENGLSAISLVGNLIKSGHEAMLEHGGMTVKFIVDRGISHELVRHRLASFAQESTRWCNYSKDKFGVEISVIRPFYLEEGSKAWDAWKYSCEQAEVAYFTMLNEGCTAQEARAVLPTCLKTEIVVTANWREWRHILSLRTAPDAHPQIRQVMMPLLEEIATPLPLLFFDIYHANCGGQK